MKHLALLLLLVACGDVKNKALPDAPSSNDGSVGVCGDGTTNTGEACDLGALNGQAGSCCAADCSFAPASVECRAATGSCDVAETCTGTSEACPADTTVGDGGACTDGGGSTCCGGACSYTAQAGTCDACALAAHGPQQIAIIESQSSQAAHDMDTRWETIATAAGHTATILPQTALDDVAGLATYDILIVSSGVLDVPANRRATIDAFAASKRGVYLQAEYQTTYTTNLGFGEIVAAHGGQFAWTASVVGQQDPTAVNGCLATTPEASAALTAYWYGATGTGTAPKLETIHTAPGGEAIGWSFCLPGGGLVISNTDQDFIRDQAPGTPEHMRNVLVRLADAAACDGAVVN